MVLEGQDTDLPREAVMVLEGQDTFLPGEAVVVLEGQETDRPGEAVMVLESQSCPVQSVTEEQRRAWLSSIISVIRWS